MTGNDIAAALVEAARAENATQIVLGATNRSRWHEIVNGSIINRVVRLSGLIDVHVISERPDEGPEASPARTPRGAAPPVDEAGPHPAVATPAGLGVGDHP